MATKYVLKLSKEEREELSRIAKGTRGKRAIAAWKVVRAKTLLKCDQGEFGPTWTDQRIADALEVTERSIQNWRKKAVLEGPEAALTRKTRVTPPVPPKVNGRVEAADRGQTSTGRVAWTGSNPYARSKNTRIRLYLKTWDNPHPQKRVDSIDYASTNTTAAPFCVAISVEEPLD